MDKPTPKERPRKGVRFFIDPAMSDQQIFNFIQGLEVESDPEPNSGFDDTSNELKSPR